jgi:hypothetical protein
VSYAFTYDVPIDEDFYKKIQDGLGPEVPKGLITHLVVKLPEGGLRYFDVWEKKDDFVRFADERLHPVIHPLIESAFGFVPPEPVQEEISVLHVWNTAGSFS